MKYANGFFVLVGIALAIHLLVAEAKPLFVGPSTPEQTDAR